MIKILKGVATELEVRAIEQALKNRSLRNSAEREKHNGYGKPILRTSTELESHEQDW